MYKCDCGKEFNTRQGKNAHQVSHKDKTSRYKVKRSKIVYGFYNCLFCRNLCNEKKNHLNKYCDNKCQMDYEYYTIYKPLVELGKLDTRINRTTILRFLIERDGYKCSQCHISNWLNNFISLDIDHIDGNNKNNLPTNLHFLCPNCHRQTPTWGNKKYNSGLLKEYSMKYSKKN